MTEDSGRRVDEGVRLPFEGVHRPLEGDRPPVYHFVGHVHWDREWMSGREESRVLLADFMFDLLDWLEHDDAVPAFILDGHTALIEDFLTVHAQERDRVAALVAAGRLRVGPWYILSDEFLPSGEAHLRNLSLGIETATALGGVFRAGWLPDQFGHIAQMPQILAGHGIDTAVIYRGFGGEPGQESSEYKWVAPNGSHVLMLHLHADGYSFGYFSDDDEATMRARFARLRALTDGRARTAHRLILNGGDRHWPDRALPAAVEMFQREEDVDVRISRFEDVVEAIRTDTGEASLPRWVRAVT